MTDWNHQESRFVEQVMGAYLMIKTSFVKKYGLMDERYFVFLEDADLCKKVALNGGKVFYNSNISITHDAGSSTDNVSDKKMAYLIEGKLKYAYKYFPIWKYYILFLAVFLIEPLSRTLFTLVKKPNTVKDVFNGYILFIKRYQFK